MERAFKVGNDTAFYRQYFKWVENDIAVNNIVAAVLKDAGFQTTAYSITDAMFAVYPTKDDTKRFSTQFYKKPVYEIGRRLKKNSAVYTELRRRLTDAKLSVMDKPRVGLLFGFVGRAKVRLFHYGEDLYCSVDLLGGGALGVSADVTEIKLSEFYKIVEIIKEQEDK